MEGKRTTKTKAKRMIELAALALTLIVLPIGTYLYTSKGWDYFQEMKGELHEYGQLPDFALEDQTGQVLEVEDVKGRIVVSSFMKAGAEKSDFLVSQVAKLYDQFKDTDVVVFLFYILNPESTTVASLNNFAQASGLTDEEQCFFLTGDPSKMESVLANGYKWPTDYGKKNREEPYQLSSNSTEGESYYPYVVLSDTSNVIRNYYSFEDNRAMGRLVEHIALMLPNRGKGKPVVRREVEK